MSLNLPYKCIAHRDCIMAWVLSNAARGGSDEGEGKKTAYVKVLKMDEHTKLTQRKYKL